MTDVHVYIPGPDLVERVTQDFPGREFRIDDELAFYRQYTDQIRRREELFTVRYSGDRIRIPRGARLPWFETDPDNPEYKRHLGTIVIPAVVVADVEHFPEGIALLDAYASKPEMIEDLELIYGSMRPTDMLSGYMLGRLSPLV